MKIEQAGNDFLISITGARWIQRTSGTPDNPLSDEERVVIEHCRLLIRLVVLVAELEDMGDNGFVVWQARKEIAGRIGEILGGENVETK